MSRRRLIRWSLILVILAAFVVWLEPTRVVWGWLRGEAFYQGRPTSWWREELNQWTYTQSASYSGGKLRFSPKTWQRAPNFFQQHLPKWFPNDRRDVPLLKGDPAARDLLQELLSEQSTVEVGGFTWYRPTPCQELAHEAMWVIEQEHKDR